jgi:hypothetical protein
MARCTAPVYGHRTASAAANCPACRGRGRSSGYTSYPSFSRSYPSYDYGSGTIRNPSTSYGGSGSSGGKTRPRWSPAGSTLVYTPSQVQALTPVRESVVRRALKPELKHIFLCHAWDDRKEAAKELHDLLEAKGVSVWFSEKDVLLGAPLMREIDKGLAKSRIGIVLVTPALLRRLEGEGIADKELSALLHRELLVPIMHNATHEELRDVSPMLASRSGLSTGEESMANVAAKLAELALVE